MTRDALESKWGEILYLRVWDGNPLLRIKGNESPSKNKGRKFSIESINILARLQYLLSILLPVDIGDRPSFKMFSTASQS